MTILIFSASIAHYLYLKDKYILSPRINEISEKKAFFLNDLKIQIWITNFADRILLLYPKVSNSNGIICINFLCDTYF